jgi:hypothetical protein
MSSTNRRSFLTRTASLAAVPSVAAMAGSTVAGRASAATLPRHAPVLIAFPTADFWYLRDGMVEVFDCHIAFTTLYAQLGILPDYASAAGAPVPAS